MRTVPVPTFGLGGQAPGPTEVIQQRSMGLEDAATVRALWWRQRALERVLEDDGESEPVQAEASRELAAAGYQSRPSLGQSGPLTGMQLFIRVNCKLGLLGQTQVDVPPEAPQFPDPAPQNLVITNTAGVVAVKLTCPTDPGETTVLRASPPQNSAVRACRNFRIIGVCPAPVAGAADITGLYTAEFGAVPVGKRLFVRASTMVDGFESLARQFQARVPAATS